MFLQSRHHYKFSNPNLYRSIPETYVRSFFAQRARFENWTLKSNKHSGESHAKAPLNQNSSSTATSPTLSNSASPSTQNTHHASSNSGSSPPSPASGHSNQTAQAETSGFQLKLVHVILFSIIFLGGALFATMTLQFTADIEFSAAVVTVLKRTAKSVAFRQLIVIAMAILVVRFGLNSLLKTLASFSSSPVQWDKSKLFYILREVYQPLELLLVVAALCLVADTFMPSLVSLPKTTVSHVVKTIMSTSFIAGFSSVVFNLKSRFCKEKAWEAEMKGDLTQQRRWEAYDKLGAFVIYVLTFVLGIQAIGLEVTSVLAIGGIGGLAIGLAGREICENLLNGFLIMSTTPFEVGDEITFYHSNVQVEGIVIDIGWYRTQIRSFEREVFVIPNSVFSKNIVLNTSRRVREFRFCENISIRVQDVDKANSIIQDIRRIVRNDTRIINKLHRRIFLDKITHDDCKIYLSFYLEAASKEAFMAIKQDMLLAFVDVVERNGAKLATPRTLVEMDKEMADAIGSYNPVLAGIAAAQSMAQAQQNFNRNALRLPDTTTISAEAIVVNGHSRNSGSSSSHVPNPAAAAIMQAAAPQTQSGIPPFMDSTGGPPSSINQTAGASLAETASSATTSNASNQIVGNTSSTSTSVLPSLSAATEQAVTISGPTATAAVPMSTSSTPTTVISPLPTAVMTSGSLPEPDVSTSSPPSIRSPVSTSNKQTTSATSLTTSSPSESSSIPQSSVSSAAADLSDKALPPQNIEKTSGGSACPVEDNKSNLSKHERGFEKQSGTKNQHFAKGPDGGLHSGQVNKTGENMTTPQFTSERRDSMTTSATQSTSSRSSSSSDSSAAITADSATASPLLQVPEDTSTASRSSGGSPSMIEISPPLTLPGNVQIVPMSTSPVVVKSPMMTPTSNNVSPTALQSAEVIPSPWITTPAPIVDRPPNTRETAADEKTCYSSTTNNAAGGRGEVPPAPLRSSSQSLHSIGSKTYSGIPSTMLTDSGNALILEEHVVLKSSPRVADLTSLQDSLEANSKSSKAALVIIPPEATSMATIDTQENRIILLDPAVGSVVSGSLVISSEDPKRDDAD
ncbi:hypothetical protein CEUSTIGMA_g9745.t1 [Chlamydomonas eustigma]|uniref:Mechanosensitive ion channel protein n=1 Tax=Chlamydomonas eustigma TaxID=1157962 RepID=A0A250XH17_9CHLO|nr:hypothetical protein CEUSTIGMA_g9745.t1 [Chlamydomonas eustigma]|eukprot:GAX82316.1 hypothetical protein CEUSTIGMA_g9745.t1 [Chlamydomonas eustigma]